MPLSEEEKKRIHEEEKERIIAQEKAKMALKAEKSKQGAIGCLIFLGIIVVIAIILAIFNPPKPSTQEINAPSVVSKTDPYAETTEEAKRKFIDYEILGEWYTFNGGFGMNILVSEKAKKEEIMALAKHIRAQNISKVFFFFSIYDSREAYNHRFDDSYPENKRLKHTLVDVTHKPDANIDEFSWIAEGRNR